MLVKEIMNRDVASIHESATIREAVAMFCNRRVSALPVIDSSGRVQGIVTEHDIIKSILPTYQDILSSDTPPDTGFMESRVYAVQDNPVSDIMTRNVIAVEDHDPVLKAATTMVLKKVKVLPVVAEGKLVGILNRMDIVGAVVRHCEA